MALNLTRDELATFLKNHQQIKQFENLFGTVNENTTQLTELEGISLQAASAMAIAQAALAVEAWPVGSLFIGTTPTNPAIMLGYGTWVEFGSGKVLIGQDTGNTDFDTLEEEGGDLTVAAAGTISGTAVADHTSHTHTYTDVPNHTHPHNMQGGTTGSNTGTNVMGSTATGGSVRAMAIATSNPTGGVATGTTNGPNAALSHNVTDGTFTGTPTSVVQPYIVVIFWQRTA